MKVLITGASDGIGRELAKQLTADGHLVWGIARRKELLEQLQNEIGNHKFLFSVCDVGKEDEVDSAVKLMKEKEFLPEAVVLNAALFLKDTQPNYQHHLFKQAVGVNLVGSLMWVGKLVPDFISRGSGSFVAVSSVAAYRPNPKSVSLSSSKAALVMAFRGLRIRYQKQNINFSVINFGPVATNLVKEEWVSSGNPRYFFVSTAEKAASYIRRIIYARRKKASYWFPFLTTALFRLTLFLPDNFFVLASRILKK